METIIQKNLRYIVLVIVFFPLISQSATAAGPQPIFAYDTGNDFFYLSNGTQVQISGISPTISQEGRGELMDVDNDGELEMPFTDTSNNLYAVDKNLEVNTVTDAAPKQKIMATGDLDGDGHKSIYYVNNGGNKNIGKAEYQDGSWTVNSNFHNPGSSTQAKAILSVADIDGDDNQDLVFLDGGNALNYYDEATSSSTQFYSSGIGSNSGPGVGSVADFDNDGTMEASIVGGSQEIKFVQSDGTTEKISTSKIKTKKTPFGLGRFYDSGKELIAVDQNGKLHFVNYTGDNSQITVSGQSISPNKPSYVGRSNKVQLSKNLQTQIDETISINKPDTSRQISLGKSQITGLSYASAGLSSSFTKRLLTESLGFSPGRDRKQRLRKGVSSSVGVSRSVSNFKASFPVFSSVFSAGSVISDVYATEKSIQDILGISDTVSDEALFTGAVQDGFGLQTSQGKGIAQRLLELALGVSSEEGRSVGLNRSSQEVLSLVSSESPALSFGRNFIDDLVLAPQNRVQQDVLRLLSESIGFDLFGTRDQSIQRMDNNTITGSSSFSATSDVTRLILEAFSQDSTLSRSDLSFTRLLSQSFSTSGRFGEPVATGLVNIALGVDQSFDRSSTVLGRTLLSDFLASSSPIGQLTSARGTNQTLAAGNRIGATGLFFGSSTQNLGVEQSIGSLPNFIVSVTQLLQSDGSQSSSILLQRSSDFNLSLSNSNSRNIFVLRSFSSGLSPSFTPSVFNGAIAVVQQLIGLSSGETDTLVSPRTQDTGIGVSSGISENQTVFRSFTQSLVASTAPSFLEGFIDDLVNGVACRIFGQDSTFCDPEDTEDSSSSDDSDDGPGGGGGIGNIGGQNQTQALDNGTESPNNMTQDKDAANGENMSLSDTNRSSSISVNVSLESENNSKPSVELENVSSGEKVSLNIQERPRDESQTSKPSQDLETAEDESVELDAISFQVEKKSEDSAINVTTVENPSKLNLTSENKIYKATEVSTSVETGNAELIYNVQKSFLSQNNATKNDLVVNRWKNSSRIQTLPTEVLNESASNLTVKAASPNGFSIFTVGLKNTTSNASVTSREFNFEYTFPNIQLVKLFKAILIFSSLYLIRYPLLKTLFTLDIRLSYIIEGVHVRVLELRRRLRWWLDAEEGREEFGLAGDVNSLRNKKEALQFKKNRLEKEVERKKELRNRYLMRLELLTNKVEKWREKLEG